MAEKINKLFGQALDKAVPETWTTLSHDQLMRVRDVFAELIVRECMNIVENHPIDPEDMPYNMRIIPYMIEVQEKMKLQFGVEE